MTGRAEGSKISVRKGFARCPARCVGTRRPISLPPRRVSVFVFVFDWHKLLGTQNGCSPHSLPMQEKVSNSCSVFLRHLDMKLDTPMIPMGSSVEVTIFGFVRVSSGEMFGLPYFYRDYSQRCMPTVALVSIFVPIWQSKWMHSATLVWRYRGTSHFYSTRAEGLSRYH